MTISRTRQLNNNIIEKYNNMDDQISTFEKYNNHEILTVEEIQKRTKNGR